MALSLSATPIQLGEVGLEIELDFLPKWVSYRSFGRCITTPFPAIDISSEGLGTELVRTSETKFYFSKLVAGILCTVSGEVGSASFAPGTVGLPSSCLVRSHSNFILGKGLVDQFVPSIHVESFRCSDQYYLPSHYQYSLADHDIHLTDTGKLTVVSYTQILELDILLFLSDGSEMYVRLELVPDTVPPSRLVFQKSTSRVLDGISQYSFTATRISGSSLLWTGTKNLVTSYDAVPAHTSVVIKGHDSTGSHSIEFDVTEDSVRYCPDSLPPIVALTSISSNSSQVAQFLSVPIVYAPTLNSTLHLTSPFEKELLDIRVALGFPVDSQIVLRTSANQETCTSASIQANSVLLLRCTTRCEENFSLEFSSNDITKTLNVTVTRANLDIRESTILVDESADYRADPKEFMTCYDDSVELYEASSMASLKSSDGKMIEIPSRFFKRVDESGAKTISVLVQDSGNVDSVPRKIAFHSFQWDTSDSMVESREWRVGLGTNHISFTEPIVAFQVRHESTKLYARESTVSIEVNLSLKCSRHFAKLEMNGNELLNVPRFRIKFPSKTMIITPVVVPSTKAITVFGFNYLPQPFDPTDNIENPQCLKLTASIKCKEAEHVYKTMGASCDLTGLTISKIGIDTYSILPKAHSYNTSETSDTYLSITGPGKIWTRTVPISFKSISMFARPHTLKHVNMFSEVKTDSLWTSEHGKSFTISYVAHRGKIYLPGETIFGKWYRVIVTATGDFTYKLVSTVPKINGHFSGIGDFFCLGETELAVLALNPSAVPLGPFFIDVVKQRDSLQMSSSSVKIHLPEGSRITEYRIVGSQNQYIDAGSLLNTQWGRFFCTGLGIVTVNASTSAFPPVTVKIATASEIRTCQIYINVEQNPEPLLDQNPESPRYVETPVETTRPPSVRALAPPKRTFDIYPRGTGFTPEEIETYQISSSEIVEALDLKFLRDATSEQVTCSPISISLPPKIFLAFNLDVCLNLSKLIPGTKCAVLNSTDNLTAILASQSDDRTIDQNATVLRVMYNGSENENIPVLVFFERNSRLYLHEIQVCLRPQTPVYSTVISTGRGSTIRFSEHFKNQDGTSISEQWISDTCNIDLWVRDSLSSWNKRLLVSVLDEGSVETIDYDFGMGYISSLEAIQTVYIDPHLLVKRVVRAPLRQQARAIANDSRQVEPSPTIDDRVERVQTTHEERVEQVPTQSVHDVQTARTMHEERVERVPDRHNLPPLPAISSTSSLAVRQRNVAPVHTENRAVEPSVTNVFRARTAVPPAPTLSYRIPIQIAPLTRAKILIIKKNSTAKPSTRIEVFLFVRYPLSGDFYWSGPENGCISLPGGVVFIKEGIYSFRGTGEIYIKATVNPHFALDSSRSSGTVEFFSEKISNPADPILRAYIYAHGETEPSRCTVTCGEVSLVGAGPGCTLACYLRSSAVKILYLV